MAAAEQPTLLAPDEVAARFRRAKRQGTPAWVWPEVTVPAWRDAVAEIEAIARDALFCRPAAIVAAGDAAAFGLACYTSGMGPLLGWWQAKGLVRATPAIGRAIELQWRHNTARNRRLVAVAADVAGCLDGAGVSVVALKGVHTATAYFPERGTRPMADIDLLIGASGRAAAEAALTAAGFAPGRRLPRETSWHRPGTATAPRTLTFLHEDDPWSIDLHHSLDLVVAAGAPPIRFDAGRTMDGHQGPPMVRPARVLDQPLLLLHLAAHAGGGLHNLTLLRLAELHYVIRRDTADGRLSWPAFIELGRSVGALAHAYPALRLCEDLAPGTVPVAVLDRCAAAAPARVLRVVGRLTPASAQRVDRSSIAEHFMWALGWTGLARQLAADIFPAMGWRGAWAVYQRRAWQVLRRRLSA